MKEPVMMDEVEQSHLRTTMREFTEWFNAQMDLATAPREHIEIEVNRLRGTLAAIHDQASVGGEQGEQPDKEIMELARDALDRYPPFGAPNPPPPAPAPAPTWEWCEKGGRVEDRPRRRWFRRRKGRR